VAGLANERDDRDEFHVQAVRNQRVALPPME
jgi:hypothetical protein